MFIVDLFFAVFKKIKFIAILIVLTFSFAEATEISPYFYTWGYNNSYYKVQSLMDAKRKTNVDSMTLAFAISKGKCQFDGAVERMTSDIKSFMAAGGKVTISFGGAAGTYIEEACQTDDSLFNVIDQLIIKTGVIKLDFDIEGQQLKNLSIHKRRTRVLSRLQKKYSKMFLSYTLPVSARTGLNQYSLNLISQSVEAGLNINIINLMTMDYYYQLPGKTMGDLAIQSVEKTILQIEKYFPSKNLKQLYKLIGITPMIGLNDDQFIFTIQDAKKVSEYAHRNEIGLISYWAFQRDQVGKNDINKYSGQNSYDFQYYNIFKGF